MPARFKIPNSLNTPLVKKVLAPLFYRTAKIIEPVVFADRLALRLEELGTADCPGNDSSNNCANQIFDISGPIEQFKCCSLWQQKLANKLNSKYFVQKLGIKVAKLIWYGTDPNLIPFESLPQSYVIKSTSGSRNEQVIPVKDGINMFTRQAISTIEIKSFFENLYTRDEFKHSGIIVEEYLTAGPDHNFPMDIKLFCFGGEPFCIQHVDRWTGSYYWYDKFWNPLHDQINLLGKTGTRVKMPRNLDEIIKTGEILSKAYDYPFVRIDLYNTSDGLYFGEFTPTPVAGYARFYYTPYANIIFSRLWEKALTKQTASAHL
jgi:hypothetical protein